MVSEDTFSVVDVDGMDVQEASFSPLFYLANTSSVMIQNSGGGGNRSGFVTQTDSTSTVYWGLNNNFLTKNLMAGSGFFIPATQTIAQGSVTVAASSILSGACTSAITAAAPSAQAFDGWSISAGGTGYVVGDVLSITQSGGSGGEATVEPFLPVSSLESTRPNRAVATLLVST